MPIPEQNPNIVALYNSLCAQQDALSEKIQNTPDPDLADQISTEIQEILHRIILTQNLLFQADSAALKASVASVQAADAQLTTAIGQIQKASDVVNSVSNYLGYVDQAIDLAKKLAV